MIDHTTKVAILGANGQVGSALCALLSEDSRLKVIALCRNKAGANILDEHIETRIGQVLDLPSAQNLLGDCDILINCALAGGLPRSSWLSNKCLIENLASLKNLKLSILFSSVAVYGPLVEASKISFERPDTCNNYARLKFRIEKLAQAKFAQSGIPLLTLRLGHVYGPNQWLSRTILELLSSSYFAIPFDGKFPSNTIHIDELGSAIKKILAGQRDNWSGIFNLTSYPQKSWREVFDWHAAIFGKQRPKSLSLKDSEIILELIRRDNDNFSQFRKFFRTIRQGFVLGVSYVAYDPWVKSVVLSFLSALPQNFGANIKRRVALTAATRDIEKLEKRPEIPPFLFARSIPGVNICGSFEGVAMDSNAPNSNAPNSTESNSSRLDIKAPNSNALKVWRDAVVFPSERNRSAE